MSLYLPDPIAFGYRLSELTQKTALSEQEQQQKKNCKVMLFHTVIAIVEYIAARQFSNRLGITMTDVALGGLLIFPQSTRFAVTGHVCVSGLSAAASAAMRKDVMSLTKNLALAAFGYMGSTSLPGYLLQNYVYNKL